MADGTKAKARCFACGRIYTGALHCADTRDDQTVEVGPECFRKIDRLGDAGYQPPKGGPRLYPCRGAA
jgi:hypothetical protein